MTKWGTGNPVSRTHKVFGKPSTAYYGDYRRKNANQTVEHKIKVAVSASRRHRAKNITLPDRPFDFGGDQ